MSARRTTITHTPTVVEAFDLAAEGIFIQDISPDLEALDYYFEDDVYPAATLPDDFEDDTYLRTETDDGTLSNFY